LGVLRDVLLDLEAAWSARGAPVSDLLAPGLEPAQVRESLDRWRAVPDDLIAWFEWHDGSRPGVPAWQLAPSAWSQFSLADVIAEHDVALQVAEDLVGWADEGFGWSDSWIPFIGIREDVLAIDGLTGQIVRGNLGDPNRFGDVVVPDIETLIRKWLTTLESGYGNFRWDSHGFWEMDWLTVPPEIMDWLQ